MCETFLQKKVLLTKNEAKIKYAEEQNFTAQTAAYNKEVHEIREALGPLWSQEQFDNGQFEWDFKHPEPEKLVRYKECTGWANTLMLMNRLGTKFQDDEQDDDRLCISQLPPTPGLRPVSRKNLHEYLGQAYDYGHSIPCPPRKDCAALLRHLTEMRYGEDEGVEMNLERRKRLNPLAFGEHNSVSMANGLHTISRPIGGDTLLTTPVPCLQRSP
jgi:hypothetical protein